MLCSSSSVYMLLELLISVSSSNKFLDTDPIDLISLPSSDPDPGCCFFAAVMGVSQTMSVHATRRFLRLECCLDPGTGTVQGGSFPGCFSAHTRRRSGTQLVKEENLRSLFRRSCARASCASCLS